MEEVGVVDKELVEPIELDRELFGPAKTSRYTMTPCLAYRNIVNNRCEAIKHTILWTNQSRHRNSTITQTPSNCTVLLFCLYDLI